MSNMTVKQQENMQTQRRLLEQLRAESSLQRLPVSECVAEIIKYCEALQDSDVLIKGFSRQGDNPFREKSGCTIL